MCNFAMKHSLLPKTDQKGAIVVPAVTLDEVVEVAEREGQRLRLREWRTIEVKHGCYCGKYWYIRDECFELHPEMRGEGGRKRRRV